MQSKQERDVALVLRDAKEITVSGNELSAASDFFFALQNADMTERREGIIRFEHISEDVMRDVLEFMRSGSVLITYNNAEDLIVAADYFLLLSLKRAAVGFLRRTLQPSNCISIYYFAERYLCEDLVLTAREFIFSNFAAVAKSKEFLKLERQEVEKWISRDEIVVSSEDAVFRIILKWIKQRKTERRGKFLELFRHVRLSFVSRGFSKKYVVSNNFVKESSSCLKRVKDALKGIFPQTEDRQQSPRNWSDSHLVIFAGKEALCYDPVKDKWYQLSKEPVTYSGPGCYPCPSAGKLPGPVLQMQRQNVSCHQAFHITSFQGKRYAFPSLPPPHALGTFRYIYYSPLNRWSYWSKNFYRMVSSHAMTMVGQHIYSIDAIFKFISKYNATSNTWNVVSSGEETARKQESRSRSFRVLSLRGRCLYR